MGVVYRTIYTHLIKNTEFTVASGISSPATRSITSSAPLSTIVSQSGAVQVCVRAIACRINTESDMLRPRT